MIGTVLSLVPGRWLVRGGILVAIGLGVLWLRHDAAGDARRACEARFTDMIERAAFDEAIRRAEAAEASLRAARVLADRDAAEIEDLTREVDAYEADRAALPAHDRCLLDQSDIDGLRQLER